MTKTTPELISLAELTAEIVGAHVSHHNVEFTAEALGEETWRRIDQKPGG